jgi:hypothetical protein
MKKSYFSKAFLPAGFALSLFASPSHNFILTAPDNLSQIGKGMFEAGSGDSVQVRVTLRDKEFVGSGTMTAPPPKHIAGVRTDRALMAPRSLPYSKHGFATLNANDGSPSSLACEFYVRNGQVDGHCFDPMHKESPISVHPSPENKP